MAVSSAVFVRSSRSFPEIIGACQQLLLAMRSDAKIVGFMEDATYGGYKMFFSDERIVAELLKKKFLMDSEEASIYPSITRLTIRKVFPIAEDTFRKELLENLLNLGPVLDIVKIPVSAEFPDIGSGDWRVILEIPEIKDLDVFKRFGLPDEMLIKLPSIFDHLTVKFFCSRCKLDGHTQFDCEIDDCLAAQVKDPTGIVSAPPTLKPQKVPVVCLKGVRVPVPPPKKVKSPAKQVASQKKPSNTKNSHPSEYPNRNVENPTNSVNLDPKLSSSSRNIFPDTEISSNSENPETNINASIVSGNPSTDLHVSSNSGNPNADLPISSYSGTNTNTDLNISSNSENPITTDFSNSAESAKQKEGQTSNISSIIPECLNIKKELMEDSADESTDPPRKKRLAFTLANISGNFIEPDEDIYNPSMSRNSSLLFSPAATVGFPRSSAEDSVSTSNLTDVLTELVKTEYRSEDENDPEFREDRRKAAYRKRKKPTLDQPILIPERIRSIINEKTNGPLKADTMEAFFTHTKKKSKPCEIAKIFHPDVEALKSQLDTVQREYYSTNAAPRKEEREFMKWFVGMLQRFYGTVSVRRRH